MSVRSILWVSSEDSYCVERILHTSISGEMHPRNKNRDITQLFHGRSDGGWVRQAIRTRWTYKWFVIPVAYHDRQRSDARHDSWISDACQQTLGARTPCSNAKWQEGHILIEHLVAGHALVMRARLMLLAWQCLALSERAAAAEHGLSRHFLLPQSARGAELKLSM